MLSKSRWVFIGLLLLECAVCILVGSFFYHRYQTAKEQERAQYIVRLSESTIQATASGSLQYYYTLKPNSLHTEAPAWLGYTSLQTYNHDGLNDRFDYALEKPSDTLRIITLGDSFTHGDFVSTPDNWTELLEDKLNQPEIRHLCEKKKIEVINLGVTGFDVQYIAHRYHELGKKYQPDLIIWFESGSGFTRFNELMQPAIRSCQEKGANLSLSAVDKLNYEYECWKAAANEVGRTHTPAELHNLIAQSYSKFFQDVGDIPVLIVAYQDPKPEETTVMTELFLKGHPNARFLPVVPYLTPETRLPDGHPSKAGHAVMEAAIRQQLFKLAPEICSTAK